MSWRRITVDGQPFRWTVSISGASRISGELNEIRLTVIVRPQARDGRRRSAVFHGFCVEDLFAGRRQNVMVRPATIAALIRRLGDGETLDHAEREFPDAVTAADPQDEALAAACSQWFVPYPGRAALEAALLETRSDYAAVAQRFSTRAVTLGAAQVQHWASQLGLAQR